LLARETVSIMNPSESTVKLSMATLRFLALYGIGEIVPKMRYVIKQGSMFVDGGKAPGDSPEGSHVAMTKDVGVAHDFRDRAQAKRWLIKKGLAGKIIEISDNETWRDVTHSN